MRVCDRCKEEIEHSLTQVIYPIYSISGNYGTYNKEIDLCPKCCGAFTKWLKEHSKEDQNA